MLPEDIADLSDPDTYVRGVPHDTFRVLRREAPVYFQKEKKWRGYWALTRYEDIAMACKDPARCHEIAGKLNAYAHEEIFLEEMIIEGVLCIQQNEVPALAARKLQAFAEAHKRDQVQLGAATPGAGPARRAA